MFDFDDLERADLPGCAPLVPCNPTDSPFEIGDATVGRVIARGRPQVALAVTVFGRGALTLPFFGQLSGLEVADCFSYSAFPSSEAADLPARFGPCAPCVLIEELSLDVDRRLAGLGDAELKAEVAVLNSWRQEASGRLQALERRTAFALIGRNSEDGAEELRRAFKRRALALHPDKGGEAARFQLLQELRRSLFEVTGKDTDGTSADWEDGEEAADENVKSPEDDRHEEHEVNNVAYDIVFNRRLAEGVRRKLHGDVAMFWERCLKLEAEIRQSSVSTGRCDSGSDDWALANLKSFVGRFAPVELAPLGQGDVAGAGEVLRRFLEEGGDALALSSTLDPVGTTSVVVLGLTAPLLEKVSSPELRQQCGTLLEAISRSPLALQQSSKIPWREPHLDHVASVCSPAAQETAPPQASRALDVAVAATGIQNPKSDAAKLDVGAWRPDGSASYCTSCDRWVPAEALFDPARFRQHCREDLMHITMASAFI